MFLGNIREYIEEKLGSGSQPEFYEGQPSSRSILGEIPDNLHGEVVYIELEDSEIENTSWDYWGNVDASRMNPQPVDTQLMKYGNKGEGELNITYPAARNSEELPEEKEELASGHIDLTVGFRTQNPDQWIELLE